MKTYERPVITIDAGMAEGIYAASGAGSSVSASALDVFADWGGSGQAKFTLDLTKANRSGLTVTVTFSNHIAAGWGDGASANISGNKLILSWHSAPEKPQIYVQADSIRQLQIAGCSASNS